MKEYTFWNFLFYCQYFVEFFVIDCNIIVIKLLLSLTMKCTLIINTTAVSIINKVYTGCWNHFSIKDIICNDKFEVYNIEFDTFITCFNKFNNETLNTSLSTGCSTWKYPVFYGNNGSKVIIMYNKTTILQLIQMSSHKNIWT